MITDWPRPLTILLSEGSSLSARQTLYALGGRHRIDILDPAKLCQCRFSRFVRRWYRCPNFARDPLGYLQFLGERLQAEAYYVLLPTHEQVYLLSKFRGAIGRRVGLALPEFEALEQMQNKADFTRLLESLGLPAPASVIVRTRRELEQAASFPCYVKLSYSTAGSGVRRVDNADELRRVADDFESTGLLEGHAETVVQAPAVGVQSTVQAVFQHGRLVAAHCFEARALGVGGMSMARVSAWHPVVIDHVRRMGEHLRWHGATFIDYFYEAASGQPQYIEANPRIGETVSAMLSGRNLAECLAQVSIAQADVSAVDGPPTMGVRTHSGYMILMAKALQGASRLELMSEVRQRRAGHGLYEDSQDELTRPREDWLSVIPAAAIRLQLLAHPASARSIVRKTVENYSLPHAAVAAIRALPAEAAERWF
jgi:predicted ATP-grasp superfamily ATP-dependent carboligase